MQLGQLDRSSDVVAWLTTGATALELPHRRLPLLISYMDQCSVQASGVYFFIHYLVGLALVFEDVYHREWNDTRMVARNVPAFWRCIIHLKAIMII